MYTPINQPNVLHNEFNVFKLNESLHLQTIYV